MRKIHIIRHKITLINIRKPEKENLNQELQWLGDSLGLFNLRDRDRSCFRIFIELLKASKAKRPLNSDELAHTLGLSRGTIIHHINTLMEAGIVVSDGNAYRLRVENLQALIDEVEKDVKRTTEQLREVAKDLDTWLGL
jgi:predicted transcriptional regulator